MTHWSQLPGGIEEPIPLVEPVLVPPFPVDAFPEVISNMVRDISEAMQTDPAMAGTCAIATLSACAGGHVEILLRPGWQEPLNTFTVITAEPGERKSGVQQAMTRSLHDVQEKLKENTKPKRAEALARKKIAEEKAKKARTEAANCKREFADRMERENAAIEATKAAEDIPVPPVPRIVADDTTPEAAQSLLADHGRIAVISAEGGIFDTLAGRYSSKVNFDVFLKGHAGDPITTDRKSREPEYIPRPALTVSLMIQPAVLRAIGANKDFRGRGLLARFGYALPASNLGKRNTKALPVSDEVKNAYNDHIAALAETLWPVDSVVLTLSPKARTAFEAIEAAVEPQLADEGELGTLKDWASKYAGAIARIAGLLHLAQHDATKPVDAVTIGQAHRIGGYFRACAVNVFGEIGTDEVTGDAVYLLDRIKHLDEASERDMHYRCRSRFKTKAQMLPALSRLVDHGFLVRQETVAEPHRGRPTSPVYKVMHQGGS
jgi:replicative DNA helicase